jgi:hypothetical protein
MRIAAVILFRFFQVLAGIGFVLGAVRLFHVLRGRAMRVLAARWGFQYIGPSAPPSWLWNPAHFKVSHPLPAWLSSFYPSGRRIRQVWNVIEGQQNGVSILLFDCIVGEYKGGTPCTVIVCLTEQNPFGTVESTDRLTQSHGWTVLHGVWFLWFSWLMSFQRLNNHLDALRLKAWEPSRRDS